MEHVITTKCDTKKTPFFMSSNEYFLKDGLKYNHWVGHSVMKPIVDVAFYKRKATREGGNDQSKTLKWRFLMKVC